MKTNIGKNTLGDSNKMSVYLHEYGRSTHNLSYAWRSTMGVGTLVPFMKQLALPGDTWDIALDEKVLTHPTVGPLFGNYKLQMDVFTCPIRLYNAMLHNNALNIGLDMSKVKLPKATYDKKNNTGDENFPYFNRSSLHNFLGMKGIANDVQTDNYNIVPILAYLDIFKNYYANKQEEKFYMFTNKSLETETNAKPWFTAPSLKIVKNGGASGKTNIQGPTGESYNYGIKNQSKKINWDENPFFEIPIYGDVGLQNVIGKIKFSKTAIVSGQNDFIENEDEPATSTYKSYFDTVDNTNEWDETNTAEFNRILGADREKKIWINPNDISIINNNVLEQGLSSFYLTDIDDIRDYILGKGKQEVLISEKNPSNIPTLDTLCNANEDKAQIANLGGLILKTYQSDIFNNWVNSEWIDGENGITNLTKIDTSKGSFSIDTLNLAEKVYNMLNRIAVSGGTYKDWIETVYTTDYYFRAETPVYEGGMSATIDFAEVVSNSATETEPLGTLAGRGYASNKKGGRLKIKVNEPCYIIGIVSITPNIDYSQGNDWDIYLNTLDDLHKPQLDGIGFQDLLSRQMHWNSNKQNAIGKSVAWINYMTNYNKTFANFAAGGNESFMVLNRLYDVIEGNVINTTTYINPKDYTYIFAENAPDNMDFWVQIGCGIEARRVMSAKQIPLM